MYSKMNQTSGGRYGGLEGMTEIANLEELVGKYNLMYTRRKRGG